MTPCRFSVLLTAALVSQAFFASAKEGGQGARQRYKQLEAQLEAARGSLHEAQRELAKKAERIEDLQHKVEALEKEGRPDGVVSQKMRQEIASLRKKNGELARALAAMKREASSREGKVALAEQSDNERKSAPKRPRSITIRYDANSAANLEGRETVWRWIESRMEEGVRRFSIKGFANDSQYPEACEVIAKNRAKYLADYLILKGVARSAITVSASVSSLEGSRGRFVEVAATSK